MRPFTIAVTAALLVASASFASLPAEAKGCSNPRLDIAPPGSEHEYAAYLEAEWGDTVRLYAYCWFARVDGERWTAEEVDVFARFVSERPGGEVGELPPEPSLAIAGMENGGFDELLRLVDVYGAPEQPQPGWIEFIARANGEEVGTSMEARTSIVITADGQRPHGSAYVAGRIDNMPTPYNGIYVVWAPVDNPGAYAFALVPDSGEYRTDYLSEGEWFIGIYDINEEQEAVGPELRPAGGYSRELDKDVTLTGRTVTVTDHQPLAGIDFTLSDPPAPEEDATAISSELDEAQSSLSASDEAPASPFTQLESQSDGASAGWLGPALLGAGGGLILTFAAATRWRRRRVR